MRLKQLSPCIGVALSLLVAVGPLVPQAAAQQATPTPTPIPTAQVVQSTTIQSQITLQTGGSVVITGATPVPQASTQLVNVIGGGACGQQIFTKCLLGNVVEANLETAAVNSVLQEHQLPASDQGRVLSWARNEVRASIWNSLVAAFHKDPASRSQDEQTAVAQLTQLIQQKHVQVATVAQQEYTKWAANPCYYTPPAGFSYDMRAACLGASSLFTPQSPGLKAFTAYGAAAAYKSASDPYTQAIMSGTAYGDILLYGYAGSLAAGALGAYVGSTLTFGALAGLLPFAGTAVGAEALGSAAVGSLSSQIAASAGVASGANGAIAVGGPVLIVVASVITAVIAGITVFEEAAIPGQLQDQLNSAQTYDVGAAFNSSDCGTSVAAAQELFAEFAELTSPDPTNTATVPAAQPGDPQLLVQDGGVGSIQYTALDNSHHTARMSGGWWADTDANGKSILTTSIGYLDPAGNGWIASRTGRMLVNMRFAAPSTTSSSCSGNPVAASPASALTFQDWTGKAVTASLSSPASAWIIGGTQANIGGNFVAHYNATSSAFDKTDGGAIVVKVGPDGQPWLVNQQGAIFRRKASQTSFVDGTWQTLPGQASDFAIGADGSVWSIGTASDVANIGGSHVYHYNSSANGWEQVDGGAIAVAVGPNGQPWIVNKQGTIFQRQRGATSYVDGTWQVVPGQGTAIGIGADGSVWLIGVLQSNIGGNIIYHYNPSNPNGWDQVDGGGVAIGVGPDGQPWLVNKQGALFSRARGKTSYVDGTWTTIAPSGAATAVGVGGTQ